MRLSEQGFLLMPFSEQEKAYLLQVKGVGPTVIARLEQIGFTQLKQLAQADANEILQTVARMLSASCWKNSPQARNAINSAIVAAGQYTAANS
ncbi:helix-hairpin-helix domain-containing protein [Pseudomonas sp. F1_0610]|uniref:helix-hairpin-helix domain-containing protein n=1 Tax=Pseudomonas sp. F1_0610 TaxID=3114284 RepID=UPI0039C2EFC3